MKQDEYRLRIEAYNPESIPMERLVMYLSALAKILGSPEAVHFVRIESGSAVPVIQVKPEAASVVLARVENVGKGRGPKEAQEGSRELENLCKKDGKGAQLIHQDRTVLKFSGHLPVVTNVKFGPIKEPFTVDGQLTRLGGSKNVNAQITTPEGKNYNAEMSLETGKRLKNHLWGKTLRFSGQGKWERLEDGGWHLLNFIVDSFEPLKEETLVEVRKRLLKLEPTDWCAIADVDKYISDMRGDCLH